jgi:hypothetical protein
MSSKESQTQTAVAAAESMSSFEKTGLRDVNHLILRLMELQKNRMTDCAVKLTALETTLFEKEKLEKENRNRIIRDRIVEVTDDYLQSLIREKTRCEETLKVLAKEREEKDRLKKELDGMAIDMMQAERKLAEIPELNKKLSMAHAIQNESAFNMKKLSSEYQQVIC